MLVSYVKFNPKTDKFCVICTYWNGSDKYHLFRPLLPFGKWEYNGVASEQCSMKNVCTGADDTCPYFKSKL